MTNDITTNGDTPQGDFPHWDRWSGVTLQTITPDAEDKIVYFARPHNPHSENKERLLKYLIKHKHWSPFEMVHLTFEIRTQRDIAAQILRHRSFSFQEFSTRYADAYDLGYTLPRLRLQDDKNRQNSIEAQFPNEVYESIQKLLDASQELYKSLVDAGVAKETARRILPLCQNTRLFMTGSLRSWLHYVDVRTHPGTQLEHRQLAEQIKQVLFEQVPTVSEAMWPKPEPAIEFEPPVAKLGFLSKAKAWFFNFFHRELELIRDGF